MEITGEQYEQIAHCFPRHRGNVRYSNLEVLNAVLYATENGCKWRGLPPSQEVEQLLSTVVSLEHRRTIDSPPKECRQFPFFVIPAKAGI